MNENDSWEYSDAFLYTYDIGDPNVVYQKYCSLTQNSYKSVEIIAFIEKILEEEPEKHILHLALGILYDNNLDTELASCHFRQFTEKYNGKIKLRKRALQIIKAKIIADVCINPKTPSYCENCLFSAKH